MAEDALSAVYVSFGTFKNSLDSLAQGIPNTVDRSAFPGLSGGVQNQLFAGMKFLGLITADNKPTDDLHALAVTNEGARKEKLKAILQDRYADLFALDLMKTTPQELTNKMGESYSVTGDTKEKAVRFFLSAATHVGIPFSRLFKIPGTTPQVNGARARRKSVARQKAAPKGAGDLPSAEGKPVGTSRMMELNSGGTLTIAASLDLFSLSPEDRKFVFDLIDQLERYEKTAKSTADK